MPTANPIADPILNPRPKVFFKWDLTSSLKLNNCFHRNYGTFVPTYFRSQERKFHRWKISNSTLKKWWWQSPPLLKVMVTRNHHHIQSCAYEGQRKFHAILPSGSESSTSLSLPGAKVPGNASSMERKFHLWNFCSWEWKFMGTKVPVTISLHPQNKPKLCHTSRDQSAA